MVCSSLHATMQSFNLNSLLLQDMFVRKVTKMIELRKEDSQEVLKGWFTVDQMKSELKWTSILCWIILMHVFFRTMGTNWATTTDQKNVGIPCTSNHGCECCLKNRPSGNDQFSLEIWCQDVWLGLFRTLSNCLFASAAPQYCRFISILFIVYRKKPSPHWEHELTSSVQHRNIIKSCRQKGAGAGSRFMT